MLVPYNNRSFLPARRHENKDIESRLRRYADWLDMTDQHWTRPDLASYRDYLLQTLSPASVSSHLSSVRGHYRQILRDRDLFYRMTPEDADPVLRKAFVDEMIARIENAIDPGEAPVHVIKQQDQADTAHTWLTAEQASRLLRLQDRTTMKGLRDATILATFLATGIREAELADLMVKDVNVPFGGVSALQVTEGKGKKSRLIPYGEMTWVLDAIYRWMNTAAIERGYVFRRVHRSGSVLDSGLSTRQLQRIVGEYSIDGLRLQPHDLRRTYARLQYLGGMDPIAIRDNMGHASVETTINSYIGTLDSSARQGVFKITWS